MQPAPIRLSRRVVEWGLMGLVVMVVLLLFLREARFVQGQAELAAIRSTLGALRTASVLSQVQAGLASAKQGVAISQRNPFDLFQRRPINYLGEMDAAHAVAARPGSWVYDPGCKCVGYVPIDAQWLESESQAQVLWFRIGAGPAPQQLLALERYLWQGQALE